MKLGDVPVAVAVAEGGGDDEVGAVGRPVVFVDVGVGRGDLAEFLCCEIDYGEALLESSEALTSRLVLSPNTCWTATLPDGTLAAYLFTHAWPEDALPPLDDVLARNWMPAATLTWFVHDMAVAPVGRGTGLAAGRVVEA